MIHYRLLLPILAIFASIASYGQLFKPLGLGMDKCYMREGGCFRPQLHVEGDILYACTNQGLFSMDLSDDGNEWQLVGFEGIPIQNYARRGDEMLALRYNHEDTRYLLLSHDEGKTYEDITPDIIKIKEGISFLNFDQHPIQSDALIVSSWPSGGIYKSADFGKTWEKVSDTTPEYIGFHPTQPEIIYETGYKILESYLDLQITYNGGETWQDQSSSIGMRGTVMRIAFSPANPDRWIAGGSHQIYSSMDNGHTWNVYEFLHETPVNWDYVSNWHFTTYDDDNADIVYMTGYQNTEHKIMCSTDGGKSWSKPYIEPTKKEPEELMFDMKQYKDKLLILTETDVYEVSKAELLSELQTSVQSLEPPAKEEATVYDLLGRQTTEPKLSRGIYIQNRRKIVTQ
ncbi:MAG: hypothetical protein IJ615_09195 [Bacteroidaceae bacterium]|nr:hypothetical protein [Bacteroidaceae bacterium]